MASYQLAHRSVTGRRLANQDVVLVEKIRLADDETATLLVVADGMGGASAGDVASHTATEAFADVVARQLHGTNPTEGAVAQALKHGYAAAHNSVVQEAKQDPRKTGMGTTLVSALVFQDRLLVGNVGDSRAYLMDSGDITQITRDHTAEQEMIDRGTLDVQSAGIAVASHVLTRVIGDPDDPPQIDVFPRIGSFRLHDGNVLLLCSDGLQNGVEDDEIHDIVCSTENIDTAAEALVRAAWHGGSADNISVLLLECGHLHRRPDSIDLPAPIPQGMRAVRQPWVRLAWLAVAFFLIAVALGYVTYRTWRSTDRRPPPSWPAGARSLDADSDVLEVGEASARAELNIVSAHRDLAADTVFAHWQQGIVRQEPATDFSP